jgi:hypothetical protein
MAVHPHWGLARPSARSYRRARPTGPGRPLAFRGRRRATCLPSSPRSRRIQCLPNQARAGHPHARSVRRGPSPAPRWSTARRRGTSQVAASPPDMPGTYDSPPRGREVSRACPSGRFRRLEPTAIALWIDRPALPRVAAQAVDVAQRRAQIHHRAPRTARAVRLPRAATDLDRVAHHRPQQPLQPLRRRAATPVPHGTVTPPRSDPTASGATMASLAVRVCDGSVPTMSPGAPAAAR